MKKTILAFLVLGFANTAYAVPAVKLPPLKLCMNNSTGGIIAKKGCNLRIETVITGGALQALSSAGPQGPQGIQGPPGGLNINACVSRESTASGSGLVTTTVPCLVNEFVATSGCYVTGFAVTASHKLLKADNTTLNGEVYGLVRCSGADVYNNGSSFSVTAQAFCCRP